MFSLYISWSNNIKWIVSIKANDKLCFNNYNPWLSVYLVFVLAFTFFGQNKRQHKNTTDRQGTDWASARCVHVMLKTWNPLHISSNVMNDGFLWEKKKNCFYLRQIAGVLMHVSIYMALLLLLLLCSCSDCAVGFDRRVGEVFHGCFAFFSVFVGHAWHSRDTKYHKMLNAP